MSGIVRGLGGLLGRLGRTTVVEPVAVQEPKPVVEVETSPLPEPEEGVLIDSAFISADIDTTFNQVLEALEINLSKESNVEELKKKLQTFKDENKEIYDKIDDLKSIGFVNTPTAKKSLAELKMREAEINEEIEKINREIRHAQSMRDRIDKYKLEYPSYKFIDHKTMTAIMKKYTLFMGDTFLYNKEIPDEAIEIIKGFRHKIKASEQIKRITAMDWGRGLRGATYNIENYTPMPPPHTSDQDAIEMHYMSYQSAFARDHRTRILKEFTVSDLKMVAPLSHFDQPTIPFEDARGTREEPFVVVNHKTHRLDYSVKKVNELAKVEREVLDPIACLEVEGGFIILHAWDKEAEIPEIKNDILN